MAKRSVKKQRQRDDTHVTSATDFVHKASDLQDHEAQAAVRVVKKAQIRWAGKANSVHNLEEMRKEVLEDLANIGILATFDPTPCYYGDPPEIEILGKVSGDPIHKYGFDHERKEYEVKEAKKRNEDYRGQKERNRS